MTTHPPGADEPDHLPDRPGQAGRNSIPNPIGFVLMIGIVVAVSGALSAPPGRQVLMLVSGLMVAVILALVAAAFVHWRARRRSE